VANPHRGEIEVELGGRTITLRPTFEALARIETETGLGIYALARALQAMFPGNVNGVQPTVTMAQVVSVIAAGMSGAEGRKVSHIEAGALVLEAGLFQGAAVAFAFLARALTGGQEKNGAAPETITAA